MVKVCRICGKELPLSEFNKNCSYKDGYDTMCRECAKKKHSEYYRNNFEKFREYFKNVRLVLKFKRKNQDDMEFEKYLGGVKIYILNHVKKGEFKYNIIPTKGKVFRTNYKKEFMDYLVRM